MKKVYEAPVVEKVTFNYNTQIVASSNCIESVMNIRVGENACGEGTPINMGWNLEQTGF